MKKTKTVLKPPIHPLLGIPRIPPTLNQGHQLKMLGKSRFFARTRRGSI